MKKVKGIKVSAEEGCIWRREGPFQGSLQARDEGGGFQIGFHCINRDPVAPVTEDLSLSLHVGALSNRGEIDIRLPSFMSNTSAHCPLAFCSGNAET